MLKNVFILFIAVALGGCAMGGGVVEDAVYQSSVSTSAYLICQKNPDAIPKIMAVCAAPDNQFAEALAGLYASYDEAIDDPFLKLQADIILKAFADQYGVDLTDPGFDFSALDPGDTRPFVDLVCAGAAAAAIARE